MVLLPNDFIVRLRAFFGEEAHWRFEIANEIATMVKEEVDGWTEDIPRNGTTVETVKPVSS